MDKVIKTKNERYFEPVIHGNMKLYTAQFPWQNGVAERYVLSVREDALNQMVIFNEKQLQDLMKQYVEYYNNDRCHLSIGRNSPNGREIQKKPFGPARVISFPRISGLHQLYKWDKAA